MAVTPKGVRMINENVVQEGRGFVVNDRNAVEWNQIPDGSLYINPTTGVMMVKVAGETDWIPAGIKNDGTLVISRDTSLRAEVFTVTSLDNGDGTFTYKNANGEQRYKPKNNQGFVFELDNGTYFPGRNHLSVIINNTKELSAAAGEITEIDHTRFRINGTSSVERNDKILVRYVQWVKIGNPYPRFFINNDEPNDAEIGDFFLDLDGNLQGHEPIGDDWVLTTISWENITGKPTTIAGYKIRDNISLEGHQHNVGDIDGLNTSLNNLQNSVNSINTLVSTLSGEVTANTNNISTNTSNIAANSQRIQSLEGRMSTVENNVQSNTQAIQTNANNIASNTADIRALQTSVTQLQSDVQQLRNDVNNEITRQINNLRTELESLHNVELVNY